MPGRSINRAQDSLLETGFLDILGFERNPEPVSFDFVTDDLAALAFEFCKMGKDKLKQMDRAASGKLADSILPSRVSVFGQVYEVSINLEDYYDFVNKGVRGWQSSENAPNSPYRYKDGVVSQKMRDEIRKWLIREGLSGKRSINKSEKAPIRDRKRAAITETSNRVAYAISKSIKAKGLKASPFWDETIKEMEPVIEERLGKAMKIAITNSLTR